MTEFPNATKLPYDDLETWVGRELGQSEWMLIDQDLVDRFAELTGDDNWIHIDRERARREIGGTIAHGLLILSIVPRLRREIVRPVGAGRVLNYGYDKVRFTSPIPVGSRIRLSMSVASVETRPDSKRLTQGIVIELENSSRPALVASWTILLYSREKQA